MTSAEYFEQYCQLALRYGSGHGLARMAWSFYRVAREREERA